MDAPYLNCHNLTAGYDSAILFNDFSFTVHPGERWGIVGPNGAGKSTIFKLIKGEMQPLQGSISIRNHIRVAFIDQKIGFDENLTVDEILRAALPKEYDTDFKLKQIEDEIQLHSTLAENNHALFEDSAWMEKLTHLNTHLAEIGGAPTANIIQSALRIANLEGLAQNRFQNLSGGQQKRVQIVASLLQNPHLILLDEPTNHLDIQTVEWLEEFLLQVAEQGFSLFGFNSAGQEVEPVAYVIISHDRSLLDTLVHKILEVDRGETQKFDGNYERYTELKCEQMLTEEKTRTKMANTMRRELEWLRRGAKARTTKQTARIERAKALDKNLQQKEKRAQTNTTTELSFAGQLVDEQRDKDDFLVTRSLTLGEQELIKLSSVTLKHPAHADKLLFQDLNFILKPKMRIAILGPNGSGKSTLLRCIAEKDTPDKGEIKYHDLTQISYFDQKRNHLDMTLSVRENLSPKGDNVFFGGKYIHIMSYLERFLFNKFDANRSAAELSGGEQARLLLAKLMLEQGNVLILDEPTNDLDIPTLQVLERNLVEFNGAILFTSHDRYFMQKVATAILTNTGEQRLGAKWEVFPDLNQALAHTEKMQVEQKQQSKAEAKESSQSSSQPQDGKKKKPSFKEQKECETLEKRIQELDIMIPELNAKLEQAYATGQSFQETQKITQEIERLQTELNSAYERWEALM